ACCGLTKLNVTRCMSLWSLSAPETPAAGRTPTVTTAAPTKPAEGVTVTKPVVGFTVAVTPVVDDEAKYSTGSPSTSTLLSCNVAGLSLGTEPGAGISCKYGAELLPTPLSAPTVTVISSV